MRYNRGDLKDVIRVARKTAKNWNLTHYIYGTALEYRIEKEKPNFHQGFIAVEPSGKTTNHEYNFQQSTWTIQEVA